MKTAVEFLYEQLPDHLRLSKDGFEMLQQAKAIEEEQHQETFKQSRLAKIFEKDMPPVWESWEKYYEITFKSE